VRFRHTRVHLRGQQTTDARGVAAETGAPPSTWTAAAVSARGGGRLGRWWDATALSRPSDPPRGGVICGWESAMGRAGVGLCAAAWAGTGVCRSIRGFLDANPGGMWKQVEAGKCGAEDTASRSW
jgi:hypothetical protein